MFWPGVKRIGQIGNTPFPSGLSSNHNEVSLCHLGGDCCAFKFPRLWLPWPPVEQKPRGSLLLYELIRSGFWCSTVVIDLNSAWPGYLSLLALAPVHWLHNLNYHVEHQLLLFWIKGIWRRLKRKTTQRFHCDSTSVLCSCGRSTETAPAFDVALPQLPRKSVVRNSPFPVS